MIEWSEGTSAGERAKHLDVSPGPQSQAGVEVWCGSKGAKAVGTKRTTHSLGDKALHTTRMDVGVRRARTPPLPPRASLTLTFPIQA